MDYSIYKIQNVITKEVYIGMATNVTQRWYSHKMLSPTSNPLLKKSFEEYGITKFTFQVVEENILHKWQARERENYFISVFNSLKPNGFNIMVNGDRNTFLEKHETLGTDFK